MSSQPSVAIATAWIAMRYDVSAVSIGLMKFQFVSFQSQTTINLSDMAAEERKHPSGWVSWNVGVSWDRIFLAEMFWKEQGSKCMSGKEEVLIGIWGLDRGKSIQNAREINILGRWRLNKFLGIACDQKPEELWQISEKRGNISIPRPLLGTLVYASNNQNNGLIIELTQHTDQVQCNAQSGIALPTRVAPIYYPFDCPWTTTLLLCYCLEPYGWVQTMTF